MFQDQSFPAAEKLPRQLLTLPVHRYISRKDVNNILKLFRNGLKPRKV
jgi:dTDP-4-amino-4,6-dideoxygalactose transaminase